MWSSHMKPEASVFLMLILLAIFEAASLFQSQSFV